MKFRWDSRYLRLGVTAFAVVAASMLFYYGIFHMGTLILLLTLVKDLNGLNNSLSCSFDPQLAAV